MNAERKRSIEGKTIAVVESQWFYRDAEQVMVEQKVFSCLMHPGIDLKVDEVALMKANGIDGLIVHAVSLSGLSLISACKKCNFPVVVLERHSGGAKPVNQVDAFVLRVIKNSNLPSVVKDRSVRDITTEALDKLNEIFESEE